MHTLAPPLMPPKRIAEARQVVTGAKWFINCPEARCRAAQSCKGGLRRFHRGGPRCYPTCLKVVLEGQLAGEARTADQAEQVLDILDHDEGYHDLMEGRALYGVSSSVLLLFFLCVLAEPIGEGAAPSTAPSGQSKAGSP